MANPLARVSMLVESDQPGILVATHPRWNCGSYDTAQQLDNELSQHISKDTPGRADLLNKLRDSFRSRQRDIQSGRNPHPMWDGRNGFKSAYSILNRHSERIGLVKYPFGYRKPHVVQYGEPM